MSNSEMLKRKIELLTNLGPRDECFVFSKCLEEVLRDIEGGVKVDRMSLEKLNLSVGIMGMRMEELQNTMDKSMAPLADFKNLYGKLTVDSDPQA